MKKKYETLDEYLDDLDAIKAKIAEETASMTVEQRTKYYAGAQKRLEKKLGRKLRVRRAGFLVLSAIAPNMANFPYNVKATDVGCGGGALALPCRERLRERRAGPWAAPYAMSAFFFFMKP